MKIIRKGTFSPETIRLELYALINEMRDSQNAHLVSWGSSHKRPCEMCNTYSIRKDGIRSVIKHFGGNPKIGVW